MQKDNNQAVEPAVAKDRLYKTGFNISAALATVTLVGALGVQNSYEERVENIQKDPDTYCRDLVERKTAGREANDNDKARYVSDCKQSVQQLPQSSSFAQIMKPVAGAFGVAALGTFGLWRNHRRKHPELPVKKEHAVHEPE